ncbi:MAG: ABC transporter substrate-binding protein [Clostridiales bacterium]|nr:ABC transporter substrate-binding protein [Clostridiales bacterium]
MKRQNMAAVCFVVLLTMLLTTSCETFSNFKAEFLGEEEDPDSVIRIGIFEPLSGRYQEYGELEKKGIELAHELYPRALGKKVELVYADNKSDIYIAESAIQNLIGKNPAIVLGSYGGVYSLIGAQYLEEEKIPAISITNTNWLVTRNNPYYFRVCFVYAYEGIAAAKFAAEEMLVTQAAILKPQNDDTAAAVSQAFWDKMIQLAGDENAIISSQDYNPEDSDFTEQLRKIGASGAAVVFMPSSVDDAAKILRQAKEMGITAVFLGTNNWETADLIEKAGAEAAEGVAFSTIFDPESGITEMTQIFLEQYKNKYGDDAVPPSAVALGFDAYILAVDSLNRAGTWQDGEKVAKALARTKKFPGASGSITFDDKGDPIKSVVIKTVHDGEIVSRYTVEPNWVVIQDDEEPVDEDEPT